jgi:hypothetical protein
MSIGNVTALHLHTYFLFPFAIDIQTVVEQHGEIWKSGRTWIAGLDDWIASEGRLGNNGVVQELGRWKRASYTRLDLESKAYENVVFFIHLFAAYSSIFSRKIRCTEANSYYAATRFPSRDAGFT